MAVPVEAGILFRDETSERIPGSNVKDYFILEGGRFSELGGIQGFNKRLAEIFAPVLAAGNIRRGAGIGNTFFDGRSIQTSAGQNLSPDQRLLYAAWNGSAIVDRDSKVQFRDIGTQMGWQGLNNQPLRRGRLHGIERQKTRFELSRKSNRYLRETWVPITEAVNTSGGSDAQLKDSYFGAFQNMQLAVSDHSFKGAIYLRNQRGFEIGVIGTHEGRNPKYIRAINQRLKNNPELLTNLFESWVDLLFKPHAHIEIWVPDGKEEIKVFGVELSDSLVNLVAGN